MFSSKIRYLLYANYLNLFAFAFFTPLYALFVTDLGASPKIVGISAAIGMYATAIMIIFFGKHEAKSLNKEKLVIIGYFWMAAGAASYALISDIWQLYLVQIFNAIGVGILTPALKTVYAQRQDAGEETKQWAFWDGGNLIFMATGALLGGFLLSSLGSFKSLFIAIAGVQLLGAVVAIKILKN